ncbi:hypothetical protein KEM48_003680 [Puccinia striiformis f. sp. tritici PST-130]|nr:hypothetical protein KEM48_003680 [Puccinia striiformis f. sp. tritici PST-130]
MPIDRPDDIPIASHPASLSTISINSLKPTEFPFRDYHPGLKRDRSLVQVTHVAIDPVNDVQMIVPRVIVISGASSGIGASLVKTYAGPNNILILLARNQDRLDQVAKMARTAGCKAVETHSIDYSHDDAGNSIKQVIRAAHQKYGSIDLAISNAGTTTFTDDNPHGPDPEPWGEKVSHILHTYLSPEDAASDLWSSISTVGRAPTAQRIIKVNVTSTYAFILSAWELMKKQRSGDICIISAIGAFAGPPEFGAYGAAKTNLMSFSQSLRALSAPYGIRVSCVCPGFIESGMTNDLLAAGSSAPSFMLARSDQIATRIKEAVDGEQAGVIWPISHAIPLIMASRLNWLNGELSRWCMSKMGMSGKMVT